MKLCIAGSRELKISPVFIIDCLLKAGIKLRDITEIVSGRAGGADRSGENFAISQKIPIKDFTADWNKYGKSAGPIRNKEMAEYCDKAIIFWDGKSKGTINMMGNLDQLHKPYYTVTIVQAWKNLEK